MRLVIIDSGASVSCMDKDTYNSVKTASTKLEKSSAKIYPYASKNSNKIAWSITIQCCCEWKSA